MKLGQILLSKKFIKPQQLKIALKEQKETNEPVAQILLKKKFITEDQLFISFSEQLNVPYVELKDITIDAEAIKKMPAKFAWYYKILPIKFKHNTLTVATSDPLRSLSDIKLFLKYEIESVLAKEGEILQAIKKYYGVGGDTVEGIISKSPEKSIDADIASREKVEDIEKLAEEPSVIKLVNQIILESQKRRASDIHIERYRGQLNVRYRIDGVLYDANVPEKMGDFYSAIISRIKIMSNLNIVERRLPQDGRAVVKIGKEEFDLRISIIPTRHGEEVVIRVLPAKMLFSLEKLGLEPEDLRVVEVLIRKPHGIIFLSGHTGSGKSTTLYACLNKIKSSTNKIITIEDPIEYELKGISQIQVMPEIGFTFARGLKSMLRHDPDIMMVGEVRDFETAELAIRIALTGHLIFSTVHTNDAAGGATRLLDIGIEPYLVASSVEAFIAQRLVRVICPKCKQEDKSVNEEVKRQIKDDIAHFNSRQKTENERIKTENIRFYRGQGCEDCNFTGFKERVAIYEILLINKAIKQLILEKASTDKIREKALEQGFKTLRISGWMKVINGLTTTEEVMRVTQVEE